MSQPRETVIVPVPYGDCRSKIEVYYKDPDKPERQAQLSAGMTEAKVRLAEGASLDECMILVKQLAADGNVTFTYLFCDGGLEPFNPDVHQLGSCCDKDEPEPEVVQETPFDDADDIEDELLVEDEDDNVQVEAEEDEEFYAEEGEDDEVYEEEVDDDEDTETVDEDTPRT